MKIPRANDRNVAPLAFRLYLPIQSAKALIAPDFWKKATMMPMNTSIPSTQMKSALPNASLNQSGKPCDNILTIDNDTHKDTDQYGKQGVSGDECQNQGTAAGANDKIP